MLCLDEVLFLEALLFEKATVRGVEQALALVELADKIRAMREELESPQEPEVHTQEPEVHTQEPEVHTQDLLPED